MEHLPEVKVGDTIRGKKVLEVLKGYKWDYEEEEDFPWYKDGLAHVLNIYRDSDGEEYTPVTIFILED
jgi:hypothetical protein